MFFISLTWKSWRGLSKGRSNGARSQQLILERVWSFLTHSAVVQLHIWRAPRLALALGSFASTDHSCYTNARVVCRAPVRYVKCHLRCSSLIATTHYKCPVGLASSPMPRSGSGRASQTIIFTYILTTDIFLKSAHAESQSLRFKFSFHRRRKTIRLTQHTAFCLFFHIWSANQKINGSQSSNWHFCVKLKCALIPIQMAALGDRLIILEFAVHIKVDAVKWFLCHLHFF